MLTRRLFRQLTDAILLDTPTPLRCLCAGGCISRLNPFPDERLLHINQIRHASSSTRWKSRQGNDRYAKEAKVQGLKSRAAFKLLEINQKYKLFKRGQTVVDLGYAPGSWSQVAQSKTLPDGRVIGIDILPVQPPTGVSTIQGNFLSSDIQAEVRAYVQDPSRGRPRRRPVYLETDEDEDSLDTDLHVPDEILERGYVEMERHAELDFSREDPITTIAHPAKTGPERKFTLQERDAAQGRVVDVLLSDMSEPWPQTSRSWVKSVSNVYHRMMNTSGISFKDHAGSMDLCFAALTFAFDTLRTGGVFVCKFYQGAEDKALEMRLKMLFEKVIREKPESSRSESKEAYFVALRRKEHVKREDVLN